MYRIYFSKGNAIDNCCLSTQGLSLPPDKDVVQLPLIFFVLLVDLGRQFGKKILQSTLK